MAFLIDDIFKRDVGSYPERPKTFLIRDILSTATASADVVATSEGAHPLGARSTTSFVESGRRLSPTLDHRHQLHAVSLYDPSPPHRHHHHQHHHQQPMPASLTATIQQPPTTFLLPAADGNAGVIFSVVKVVCWLYE